VEVAAGDVAVLVVLLEEDVAVELAPGVAAGQLHRPLALLHAEGDAGVRAAGRVGRLEIVDGLGPSAAVAAAAGQPAARGVPDPVGLGPRVLLYKHAVYEGGAAAEARHHLALGAHRVFDGAGDLDALAAGGAVGIE